ncbi:MAG: hypothetical protein ACE361_26190 [Aureliella sp.]
MVNWFGKTEPQPEEQQGPPPVDEPVAEMPVEEASKEQNVELAVVEESQEAGSLMLLSQAHRAIAEARSLNELKDIRDKAEAARKYAQAAGMGLEIQNYAAEVKLRAERRAGKLLAKLNLHGGDRSDKSADHRVTLSDIGVTKDQSSRWQLTAAVPEKRFEEYVDTTRNESGEVTTAGLVRIAREIKAKQRSKSSDVTEDVTNCVVISSSEELTGSGRYACVYVDPPWPGGEDNQHFLAALNELPVELMVEDHAHLHMWADDDSLFAAKQAIDNWGFEFKGCLICLDPEGKPGQFWTRGHEYLLLGVRGGLPLMEPRLSSWMRAPRQPDGTPSERVRKIIERVSPGAYLELFGRHKASGWTIYSTVLEGGNRDEEAASE